jgi:membrane associated rhomboid family serine protease
MKIRKNIQITTVLVSIPWLVYFLNYAVPVDLRLFGLRPRHVNGLWGILTSPFLHGNLNHLIANTGALFVLLVAALAYSRRLALVALLIISVLGGGLVWILGRTNTIHIGASGIIFGLIGFLIFIGLFRRDWRAMALSAGVFFLYSGVILSLLDNIPGISWEGHAVGFLSGCLAAWWTKSRKR